MDQKDNQGTRLKKINCHQIGSEPSSSTCVSATPHHTVAMTTLRDVLHAPSAETLLLVSALSTDVNGHCD